MAIYANTHTTTQGHGFPEMLIHQGTFYFQYGGATTSANYTFPQGTSSTRFFRARMNFGDYRWNSECIVMNSNNYFGTGGNLYNHWNTIQVTTGGVVNCVNGNGGSSGNLTAELRVWVIEAPLMDWTYGGGS